MVVVRGPKRALLAWLLGRASGDGLVAVIPAGGRRTAAEAAGLGLRRR